MIVKKLKKN